LEKTVNTQIKEYLQCGGVNCPECGGSSIEGGSVELDAGIAWQNVTCPDCGASWTDQYSLTGVDNLTTE